MSRAERTTRDEETYVVSSGTMSSKKRHQPHPEASADNPAPACQVTLRASRAEWVEKSERQTIFYDDCTNCLGGDSE